VEASRYVFAQGHRQVTAVAAKDHIYSVFVLISCLQSWRFQYANMAERDVKRFTPRLTNLYFV